MRKLIVAAIAVVAATAAFAHSGVENEAVKARMDAMSAIGDSMKTIGSMAKGQVPFDTEAARLAVASIAEHAGETPALFEANVTDPKSEALPAIWDNFADFTAKAAALEEVALTLSTSIQGSDDLGPALGALGAACKACHTQYRQ